MTWIERGILADAITWNVKTKGKWSDLSVRKNFVDMGSAVGVIATVISESTALSNL